MVKFIVDNNEGELNQLPAEITDVGNDLTQGRPTSNWNDVENENDDDTMYEEAKDIVTKAGKASSSLLQRKLKVGYARAARLLDMLEERGVVGPGSGAKPREIYGGSTSVDKGVVDEYGEEFDRKQEESQNS